jgi:drug/metabolite transporter (DMT)-like permease
LSFSNQTILFGAGLALMEVVLYLALYKTFDVSNVTVATAVMSSYPILSTVFTVLVLSQTISWTAFGFIILLVLGAIMTSIDWPGVFKDGLDKQDLVKGFGWIAVTTLIHALYFPLLGVFTTTEVWETKLLLIKVFSTILLFVFFYLIKKQSVLPPKNRVAFTSLLGLLEMIGWAGYSWASSSTDGQTAILIAVLNSSALVTAVLAYFFLEEKLSQIQYFGIVVIIASLTGLSLF